MKTVRYHNCTIDADAYCDKGDYIAVAYVIWETPGGTVITYFPRTRRRYSTEEAAAAAALQMAKDWIDAHFGAE